MNPLAAEIQKDISVMMHGLGDCASPCPATVALVARVALRQTRAALNAARECAERRGRDSIGVEDVVFLLRNDRARLRRALRHVQLKERLRATRSSNGEGDADGNDGGGGGGKERTFDEIARFMEDSGVDVDREDLNRADGVERERLLRADRISQNLSLDKYEAYQKARCASFRSSRINLARFKRWLCPDLALDDQTTQLLSYLAYETIAQIVDLALLVRRDANGVADEPFAKLDGGDYCNPTTFDATRSVARGAEPITVAQTREALRRYFFPRIGINGLFYRNVGGETPTKFLAF